MDIITATKEHLEQVNSLISQYFQVVITEKHLGPDSIALVLVNKDKVLGFIWAGLLAGGSEAYIQHFVVSPTLKGTHVGALLAASIAERLIDVGITRAFAHIEDQNHYGINSLTRCLQMGGSKSPSTFKLIEFNPQVVAKTIRK